MDEGAKPRERYGFSRTVCGCELCRAPCRHIPGSLDVEDLERLCPPERIVFDWAEEHLRAVIDKSYPTLIPARHTGQPSAGCHWLFQDQCLVHANAPYGCAFFDMHMTDAESDRRAAATIAARQEDAAKQGLYWRVWQHLWRKGLTSPSGDRTGLQVECSRLRNT